MRSLRPHVGGAVFHEAAMDAAQGHRWPVDGLDFESAPGLLATQRRHVARSGLLLGLSTDEPTSERLGEILDLGGLEMQQARAVYRQGGLVARGRGVRLLLLALDGDRDDRLLAAGHVAGLWGRPWRIDPQTGRRQSLPRRDSPTSLALSPSSAGL